MLIAEKINKKMGEREILKNVSLSLNAGEIISVVGPSGAGKTTLLKALSLIDSSDSGILHVGENKYNFPITEVDKGRLVYPYPDLTVVFQQFFIWPHLTIRENIILALRGNFDETFFNELVDLFSMKDFLDRYPNEVSLGQRQRAVLTRALILRPKYLLLDEVTSALDVEQSHLILGHLRDIANKGVGIIFITHAIHLARKISDKVIFIDKGEIVEEGTADILDNPQTARLRGFLNIANATI